MDVIRWGIIGCGDVAEQKSGPPLYQTPGSELVAVMRRDQEKAADFAQRHGVGRWYTDVTSLLADPDVNAVYIASPHYLHPAHASQSALAGKIVLCEKPMGTNREDAQKIVDVCRSSGVPLTVAYYRRFWPVVQKMKALLAEDAIGRVVSARVQLADYYDGDPERLWLTSLREAGGGALANAGSHWVDLIRYLLGEVMEVMAYCSSTAGFEVEDTAAAIMRTETEAFVSFSSTWQERVGVNDFDICGTDGRILASPLSDGRLKLVRFGKEPEVFELARSGPAHRELIQELIPRLQTGQSSPVPGEEAVAVWRIIEATHRSSTEGCRIRIV
ncbi:MAG: Gfo/Idh/MocA family oxidoreductase [Chloroflexota bacterium]|nr:Gfo/Idh/MocA family oxidoreductase [Chloroflexota bacterium]